jgi:hypothetical protein
MDVAFVSSGATSRAHYALVRKVESADTTELADQYLHAEVQFIRRKLSEPTLSTVRTFYIPLSTPCPSKSTPFRKDAETRS